jgi:hypothetical protein
LSNISINFHIEYESVQLNMILIYIIYYQLKNQSVEIDLMKEKKTGKMVEVSLLFSTNTSLVPPNGTIKE